MRLHYAPNTIAVAVAIALEEAGLHYDPVPVDFAAGAQTKPDYLAINPNGRVPALETAGTILTETGAILDYIATQAPEAGLLPTDPLRAAKMRSTMYYLAGTMHVNHAHRFRGHRWADQQSSFDDMKSKVAQTMTASAHYVENACLAGPFALGTSLTLADPYLFAVCNWLDGDGVDVSQFDKITVFLAKMRERPSVQTVIQKGILKD